jgi:hypothetical protein
MEHRAVGSGTAGDAEALHHALEAFALGDADDVDIWPSLKIGDGDDVTDLDVGGLGEANLVELAGPVPARLLGVVELGLEVFFAFFLRKAELDGVIAVVSTVLTWTTGQGPASTTVTGTRTLCAS